MRTDPEGVVDGFYRAFMIHDQEGQLAYFADDAIFHQHVPAGVIDYSGVHCGKPQLAERLAYMYAHWEMPVVEPISILTDGEMVTCQMRFVFRFKPTGGLFEGRIRHIFRVVGGRIVTLDEYVDAALLKAFMELNAPEAREP